ncbi:MAG: hypothetical protein QOK47_697 [Actinomycetota bacterium]|nr:hypothetical protein [Actinomycetota bacterium]
MEITLPPQAVIDALTDFSERRPEIWPGIDPALYEVRSVGETQADVKEGSTVAGMKIWSIEHYDWSEPGIVRWTVTESNFSNPGSHLIAAVTSSDVGSHIHIKWNRTGSSLLGTFVLGMIKLTNGKPVADLIRKGLDKMEAERA